MDLSQISKAVAGGIAAVLVAYFAKHGVNLSPIVTDAGNTLLLVVVSYVVGHLVVFLAPKNAQQ